MKIRDGQKRTFSAVGVFTLILTAYYLSLVSAGCGYSTSRLLPARYQVIYVEPFENQVPVTEELSERFGYRSDLPGLEEDVTRGVIDRFLFDGNLRITTQEEKADLILVGKITDFFRQAIRRADDNEVEEYRLNLVALVTVRDRAGKALFEDTELVADATYFLTGASATPETVALKNLITDFSRRVVERVIENW